MCGSGGGSLEPPVKSSCETLASDTTLSSPNPDVLKKLKVGDRLDVVVDKAGQRPVVKAVYQKQEAGSITSAIITQLIECIDDGHMYVAIVRGVDGGACRVHVEHSA